MLASLQVIIHEREWESFVIFCTMIELILNYCSSGRQGAIMEDLITAINIVKVLLIGLGIWKDEAAVKSMSRDGDYRFIHHAQRMLCNHCY